MKNGIDPPFCPDAPVDIAARGSYVSCCMFKTSFVESIGINKNQLKTKVVCVINWHQ